jgi:ABC-type transporter Mla MlaB component
MSQPGQQTGTVNPSNHKWGVLAALALAVAFILPEWIYLVGDLREACGPFAYRLADTLYGPLRAACLLTVISVLHQRSGERGRGRMDLARLAAAFSAGMFILAALLRATNRQYHLAHPELHLEESQMILIAWSTLVGGVIATAWHCLGWALALTGWAGWSSRHRPPALNGLYLAAGAAALGVFLLPQLEGAAILLNAVLWPWQGLWLLTRASVAAGQVSPG